MTRADQSRHVLRDTRRKSYPYRQFEAIKNGTAMAQGLPLTMGKRCGETGDEASDPLMAVSQAEAAGGKACADVTPHDAASPGGAGCPAPLAIGYRNTGVGIDDSNPRRRARTNAGGVWAICRSDPISGCSPPLVTLGSRSRNGKRSEVKKLADEPYRDHRRAINVSQATAACS